MGASCAKGSKTTDPDRAPYTPSSLKTGPEEGGDARKKGGKKDGKKKTESVPCEAAERVGELEEIPTTAEESKRTRPPAAVSAKPAGDRHSGDTTEPRSSREFPSEQKHKEHHSRNVDSKISEPREIQDEPTREMGAQREGSESQPRPRSAEKRPSSAEKRSSSDVKDIQKPKRDSKNETQETELSRRHISTEKHVPLLETKPAHGGTVKDEPKVDSHRTSFGPRLETCEKQQSVSAESKDEGDSNMVWEKRTVNVEQKHSNDTKIKHIQVDNIIKISDSQKAPKVKSPTVKGSFDVTSDKEQKQESAKLGLNSSPVAGSITDEHRSSGKTSFEQMRTPVVEPVRNVVKESDIELNVARQSTPVSPTRTSAVGSTNGVSRASKTTENNNNERTSNHTMNTTFELEESRSETGTDSGRISGSTRLSTPRTAQVTKKKKVPTATLR